MRKVEEAIALAKVAREIAMESADDRPKKHTQMMPSEGQGGGSRGEKIALPVQRESETLRTLLKHLQPA